MAFAPLNLALEVPMAEAAPAETDGDTALPSNATVDIPTELAEAELVEAPAPVTEAVPATEISAAIVEEDAP